MIFTGYRQPPFSNFTWYLQDLGSLPLLVYTVFTGSRQPPFFDLHDTYRISRAPLFNLHDIYRISTAPLFQFTWYLQDLGSLPLLVYTVFTGSRQPPFFDLHDIDRVSTAPFFNLRGIYRISTAPFFQFTWYLQCYLQDLHSPLF